MIKIQSHEKCMDCKSARVMVPTGGAYCGAKVTSTSDKYPMLDISTVTVDLGTKPDWCPIDELNKSIQEMNPEKREKFETIARGLGVMFGGESIFVIDEPKIHACPLCKSDKIRIEKEWTNQGMHETSCDWSIFCTNCGMVKLSLAADNYYGRKCYKTKEEAINKWNDICKEYDND